MKTIFMFAQLTHDQKLVVMLVAVCILIGAAALVGNWRNPTAELTNEDEEEV